MVGAGGTGSDPVAAAQAQLSADPTFQFAFTLPPPASSIPGWLKAALKLIGEMLKAISPGVRIGFWVLLAIGAGFLLYVLVRHWGGPSSRRPRVEPLNLHAVGAEAVHAAARAAARLAEADTLAAEERFADAAHMLLLRGVEDVQAGRPGVVRPSSTSRDIAALPDLPPEPRAAFGDIAGVVERALFGGRPVDAEAWRACRRAYGALVRPEAWLAE